MWQPDTIMLSMYHDPPQSTLSCAAPTAAASLQPSPALPLLPGRLRALDDHHAPQQLQPAHQLQLFEWVGWAGAALTLLH